MEQARADAEGRADEIKKEGIESALPALPSRVGLKTRKRNKMSMDARKKDMAVRRTPSVASSASRRGSISMLAHQLRMLEAQKEGEVRHASKGLWGAQLLLAVTAALELGFRLYTCGPSYCSDWICLCDTFVIVGGVCLTASLKSGSAVLFLRTVRIVALGRKWSRARFRDAPDDGTDNNPAVRLYKLVMRAAKSDVFSVGEKKTLRRLLSLLAHQQIYVDITLQRGNEDYWKEYGHSEDRPRGRYSFAVSPGVGSFGCPPGAWVSRSGSPLSSVNSVHGLVAKPGFGLVGGVSGLAPDDAVGAVLAKVDQWDFDSFELEEVTRGHPLAALSTYLFVAKYNLFACFPFSKPRFTNFMVEVERGYGSGKGPGETNIYHNRRHATDVTQAVHYFLKVCSLGEHLEDVEVAALLLGALIHDFKHPGRSNAFLTKTQHSLALTYNDVSILENFHLSEAFFLLRKDECNFFRDVAPDMARELRQIMVSMVLATDLKHHFDVLGEFNSHLADVQEGVLVEEGRSKTYTCAMKVNEAMWAAKEKVGDNSLDFVSVSVPTTPPASPPLSSRTGTRRSSLRKAMQKFRSGTSSGGTSGGGGQGVEQGRNGFYRANRHDSVADRTATTAAAAAGIPLSTAGEGCNGAVSCEKLEEGRVRLRQGDSSTDLLVEVAGSSADADVEAATRETISPRDDRDDECDSSRVSLPSHRSQKSRSTLEKFFSSSTDLSL
eukprot:g14420.t1